MASATVLALLALSVEGDCEPPSSCPTPSSPGFVLGPDCLDILAEDVHCVSDGSGDISYTFTLTNNSGIDAEYLLIPSVYVEPNVILLAGLSGAGGVATGLSITISGTTPGGSFCFGMILADAPLETFCGESTDHCLGVPNCVGTSYCTANPNSTGAPAAISAEGSDSVSAADLTLTSKPVPNQPGIFFYAPNQIQVPFGNGFLCVGGGIARLPVLFASEHVATFTLDFGSLPAIGQINPGDTWNFQHWYRDPAGGGAAFNTSDGVSISFTP